MEQTEVQSAEGSETAGAEGNGDGSQAEARVQKRLSSTVNPSGSHDVAGADGVLGAGNDAPRGEVSASTIGRMMGIATSSELKLMEGKIDLLSTRVNNLTLKMEKVMSVIGNTPTGSDLERIDVQIGSLKTLIREMATGLGGPPISKETGGKGVDKTKIVTNKKEKDAAEGEAAEEEESES